MGWFCLSFGLADLLAAFASAFQQTNRLISLDLGDDHHWDGVLLPQSVVRYGMVLSASPFTVSLRAFAAGAACPHAFIFPAPSSPVETQ